MTWPDGFQTPPGFLPSRCEQRGERGSLGGNLAGPLTWFVCFNAACEDNRGQNRPVARGNSRKLSCCAVQHKYLIIKQLDTARLKRDMLSILSHHPVLLSLSGCSSCCRALGVSEEPSADSWGVWMGPSARGGSEGLCVCALNRHRWSSSDFHGKHRPLVQKQSADGAVLVFQ